jgi:beta-glucosidase-like glycosyl hydrolase
MFSRLRAIMAFACVLPIAACSAAPEGEDADQSGDAISFTGTPNEDVGQFFMIEHFGVQAAGFADVHNMVKRQNLGALILWNPTDANGDVARQMATRYAASAHDSKHPELFIAADQEERGTQRFKSGNGFTNLVSAATLGRVAAAQGNPRVCELHGRITAREMSSAGMNMTLGTVSDVFTSNSGTPGMFRTRSIGADPAIVASCIAAMTKAYGEEKHVVFITKHFPGLGNASGNTDVSLDVHTFSTTKARMEQELAPYRAATASVNDKDTWPVFGAMVSHSSYEILDATKSPATLSPAILEGLLRGAPSADVPATGVDAAKQPVSFKGMGLKGLTVSDAFWTWGATKGLTPTEKKRLMARSFLAGMDILMIAKAEFIGAWDYFQQILGGQLPLDEQVALAAAANEPDFKTLAAKFKSRVEESAARIKAAKNAVGPVASFAKTGEARAASTDLVAEYKKLTE